jgi:LacI family transcriptional regulator
MIKGLEPMKITINEVAKLAGVSKATVSRVMNDSKPVKKEKYERVMLAIKELEFKPNPVARGLVHKRTGMVGVVIPDITNPFFAELVRGIEEVVRLKNYNMILCNTFHNFETELSYLNMLRDKYVDGIIFMTAKVTQNHRDFFIKSQLPVTFINRKCEDLHVASLDIDNYQAAHDMTAFFLKRGHRRIAIIRAPLTDKTSGFERYHGYQDAMRQYGVEPDDSLVMRSNFKIENTYRVVKQFLKEQPPVTAIFATSDLMAIGAIRCLRDHQISVPQQVEVAGFDDIPMASYYNPSITTVRQPITEMGKSATRILIKEINGEKVKNRNIILPYQLVCRESTLNTSVTGESSCD